MQCSGVWGLSAGFDLSSDFCSRFCSLDLKASPSTGLSARLAGIAHWGRCSHRSGWLPGQLRLQTSTQKARKHPIHTIHTRKSVQGEALNPAAWNAVVLPSGHSTHLRSKSKCSLQVVAAPQTPEPNPYDPQTLRNTDQSLPRQECQSAAAPKSDSSRLGSGGRPWSPSRKRGFRASGITGARACFEEFARRRFTTMGFLLRAGVREDHLKETKSAAL